MMAAAGGIGFAHIPTELVVGPPLVLAAVCAQGALALALALATAVSFPARPPRSGGSSTPPPFTAARARSTYPGRAGPPHVAHATAAGAGAGGGAAEAPLPHMMTGDGGRSGPSSARAPGPSTPLPPAEFLRHSWPQNPYNELCTRVRQGECAGPHAPTSVHISASTHPSGRIFRGFFPHAGHIDFLRHVWSQNPYSELRARERQGITARARVNAHQRVGCTPAPNPRARARAVARSKKATQAAPHTPIWKHLLRPRTALGAQRCRVSAPPPAVNNLAHDTRHGFY